MNNKKGDMNVVSSLVITIIVLLFLIQGGNKLYGYYIGDESGKNNAILPNVLVSMIEKISDDKGAVLSESDSIGEGISEKLETNITFLTKDIRFKHNDLLLFFSAGDKPIYLSRKIDNPKLKNYYVFKRPDDKICDGNSCICYCPYAKLWDVKYDDSDRPKFESTSTLRSNNKSIKGYECSNMICEGTYNPNNVFVNSRGKKERFPLDFTTRIPISLEVSVLGNEDESLLYGSLKNVKQDDKILNELLNKYEFSGGVVIGDFAIFNGGDIGTNQATWENKIFLSMSNNSNNIVGVDLRTMFSIAKKDIEESKTKEKLKGFLRVEKYFKGTNEIKSEFSKCLGEKDKPGCLEYMTSLIKTSLKSDKENIALKISRSKNMIKFESGIYDKENFNSLKSFVTNENIVGLNDELLLCKFEVVDAKNIIFKECTGNKLYQFGIDNDKLSIKGVI